MTNEASKTQMVMKKCQPFLCGGFSACFASFCVQPIDLVKTRIQVAGKTTGQKVGFMSVTSNLIKNEGFFRLYAGLSASLMRQAIYGTARLGMHRSFSDKLKKMNGGKKIPFWMSSVSSITSGALAGIIGNPFDISMVRMQADGMRPVAERRGYRNCFHAIYRITADEGLMTLWRGCTPMIFRAMAMNFGMMASYDQAKQWSVKRYGEGMTTNILSSAISGFCCAFVSLPFDLMKTRLMNMSPNAEGVMPYRNLWDCMKKIYVNEGVTAFWKGFVTYYFRCAPHAMIILLVNEAVSPLYERSFCPDVK